MQTFTVTKCNLSSDEGIEINDLSSNTDEETIDDTKLVIKKDNKTVIRKDIKPVIKTVIQKDTKTVIQKGIIPVIQKDAKNQLFKKILNQLFKTILKKILNQLFKKILKKILNHILMKILNHILIKILNQILKKILNRILKKILNQILKQIKKYHQKCFKVVKFKFKNKSDLENKVITWVFWKSHVTEKWICCRNNYVYTRFEEFRTCSGELLFTNEHKAFFSKNKAKTYIDINDLEIFKDFSKENKTKFKKKPKTEIEELQLKLLK